MGRLQFVLPACFVWEICRYREMKMRIFFHTFFIFYFYFGAVKKTSTEIWPKCNRNDMALGNLCGCVCALSHSIKAIDTQFVFAFDKRISRNVKEPKRTAKIVKQKTTKRRKEGVNRKKSTKPCTHGTFILRTFTAISLFH